MGFGVFKCDGWDSFITKYYPILNMNIRAMEETDHQLLLELDKKAYPTDSPVTSEILNTWYAKNPEFGIIFEDSDGIAGMCIAIPLNMNSWKKLVSGELDESDLGKDSIFDNLKDNEIGIHIYHLERLSGPGKFYETCLKALSKIIEQLKQNNPELKVKGFSALAVAPCGIGLFSNKLNFREREFISSEHILIKDGQKLIFDSTSDEEIEAKLARGYEYQNRCKMLVTYPEEDSIIWRYF